MDAEMIKPRVASLSERERNVKPGLGKHFAINRMKRELGYVKKKVGEILKILLGCRNIKIGVIIK